MIIKNRLTEMRRLLASGWSRTFYWTDDKDRATPREVATHHCIVGAASKAACEPTGFAVGTSKGAQALFSAIQPHLPDPYRRYEYALRACICFNDEHDQKGVLNVLDKAIAAQDT